MTQIQELAFETRDNKGKGPAYQARQKGLVPAIIYGGTDTPQPITVEARALERAIEKGGFLTTLLMLTAGGKETRVIPRQVQLDPVSDRPVHVDFLRLADGATVPIAASGLIQPRAEGEIAFVLKKDLRGPGVTEEQVLDATDYVSPCFEIVDSRIRDWKIKIQDTVADNASCGVFVLGDRVVDPRGLDLVTCGMVLEKNGDVIGTGAGAAALGSPVNAVAWLANTLGRLGIPLKAGEVILSGALAAMAPVGPGDNFRVSIGGIGACSVRFA